MVKVLIYNEYSRYRLDIQKYQLIPVYRNCDFGNSYNPTNQKLVEYFIMDIVTVDGTVLTLPIAKQKDADAFIDKLLAAEEEQSTYSSINVDDFNAYVAENILSEQHNIIPGIKIPKIEFKGELL